LGHQKRHSAEQKAWIRENTLGSRNIASDMLRVKPEQVAKTKTDILGFCLHFGSTASKGQVNAIATLSWQSTAVARASANDQAEKPSQLLGSSVRLNSLWLHLRTVSERKPRLLA
jgi:hypothetical protein